MFVAVRTEWMWHYLLAVVVLIDIIAASDVKRLDGKEEVIGVYAEQISGHSSRYVGLRM